MPPFPTKQGGGSVYLEAHTLPLFGYLVLWLGSVIRKIDTLKGVGYEPTGKG